jgi:hypothetical protein
VDHDHDRQGRRLTHRPVYERGDTFPVETLDLYGLRGYQLFGSHLRRAVRQPVCFSRQQVVGPDVAGQPRARQRVVKAGAIGREPRAGHLARQDNAGLGEWHLLFLARAGGVEEDHPAGTVTVLNGDQRTAREPCNRRYVPITSGEV